VFPENLIMLDSLTDQEVTRVPLGEGFRAKFSVANSNGNYAAAFLAYQNARYLRTGRVQILACVYGEVYHAGGVARELRNQMLGGRTAEQAFESMQWPYDGEVG
jgi:hypothetical protein